MAMAGTPQQLALAGFEPAPQPRPEPQRKDSLFFAIFPDPTAAAHVARLAQQLRDDHGLKGRPLKTERFHVTLHALGAYVGLPDDVIAAAKAAASAILTRPFEVAFDRALSFGLAHNRPVVLCGGEGLAALTAFQRALGAAMERAGLASLVARSFTPHMTLLYDDRGIGERAVETVRWTVNQFALVHSLVGRTLHTPLGRWPLRG